MEGRRKERKGCKTCEGVCPRARDVQDARELLLCQDTAREKRRRGGGVHVSELEKKTGRSDQHNSDMLSHLSPPTPLLQLKLTAHEGPEVFIRCKCAEHVVFNFAVRPRWPLLHQVQVFLRKGRSANYRKPTQPTLVMQGVYSSSRSNKPLKFWLMVTAVARDG
eukprot:1351950-Rhodomonas_salina.1